MDRIRETIVLSKEGQVILVNKGSGLFKTGSRNKKVHVSVMVLEEVGSADPIPSERDMVETSSLLCSTFP